MFIEVDDIRKIGKVVDCDGKMTSVEFFTSITKREIVKFETSNLRRGYLGRQTRVYFNSPSVSRWRMGRIRDYLLEDDGTVTYEVRFPNMNDTDISERDLYVRCFGSFGDPSDVLAIGGAETQRWHDARWLTQESLVSLRSAATGLTGLTAASIELVPHQVDAVRRVLADPLQRYLLADEVGLGKTVEAGAIIRQILQDAPVQKVLVAVTTSLLLQWEEELQSKFGLELGSNVIVIDHDALGSFEGHVDFLVVDEAHRIVRGNPSFKTISRLSKTCRRLLLLSATPLIGNERTFLDLLRWLDPDRWDLESIESFKQHVSQSQEYGRLLLGLRSDASKFVLKQRALGAKQKFAGDETVQTLANELLNSLDVSDDSKQSCDALREYIADTYRIHHRVVRARRSDLEGWEFQPRGPASVRVESDDERDVETVVNLIEDWRGAALVALDDDPSIEDALADRFALLLETTGRGIASLSMLPDCEPLFTGEMELITALRYCAKPDSANVRMELISLIAQRQIRFLRNTNTAPKLVVFTTEEKSAIEIANTLIKKIGLDAVVSMIHEGEEDALRRFKHDPKAVIAVLDRRGEEGINLHFADAVLHADLPFYIGRIEQRIGRLDRFGRTKGPLKHVVVIPEGDENTPWSIWFKLLASGIEIFNRSVSDLQLVIETVEKRIWRQLLVNGADGVEEYLASLKELILNERQRLDEQYALDQLAMSREPAKVLVESMEAAEENEIELADQVEGLLGRLLNFHIKRTDDELMLYWGRDVLLPEQPWRPIFDVALRRPLTWKRRVAVNRPDVRLLRPGAPLVNAIERLLKWDDRGSAFATWRVQRGLGGIGEERLFFRLCWVVSPGPIAEAGLLKMEDAQGLYRRADNLFPSWTLVQHVGADLVEVREKETLELLERPFLPEDNYYARDFNLSSRPAWLHSVIGESEFADLCERIRDYGKEMLEGSEEFTKSCNKALEAARLDNERRLQRRKTRILRGDLSVEREFEFDAAVMQSVEFPSVRLDSVGVFVLAGYIPRGVL